MPKHPGGRPSKYNKEVCDEICLRLSNGQSLLQICRDEKMPTRNTVVNWLNDDGKIEFFHKYARAREMQAELLFDEMLDISDDGSNDWMEIETKAGRIIEVTNHEHINRSRLRIDTRKWYLSKVLPKKFGEKIDVEHTGDVSITLKGLLNESIRPENGSRIARQMESQSSN